MQPRPIVLIILDGWGCRTATTSNAIAAANTPVWNQLWQKCPHTTLAGSGLAVGLPTTQMGNSEVGHLTIGAGRVILSDLVRLSTAVATGTFNQNPVLTQAIHKAQRDHRALHILGLLSPGGVHSHEAHIHALVRLAARHEISHVFIHAFLDGRDTPPKSAEASLLALQAICQAVSPTQANIASVSGRYYAMDRDKRWERTQIVYDLLTTGTAPFNAHSALEALHAAYARGETDEFVQPTCIKPSTPISEDDLVIFMNFRADRSRQLSFALTDPQFSGFTRKICPKLSAFVTLTEYADTLKASVAFPPEQLKNTLGEYLQNQGHSQLRIAETEKYAHVTFFLNGGREDPFVQEDRILVPSKKVATYDLSPTMSAFEITEKLITAIKKQHYALIICNYANADMVGHTGNFSATVQAIEALDICFAKILEALKTVGGEAIITADHGNAEMMFDETTHQPHTAHTLERVPFVYIGRSARITNHQGALSDIAPTIISLLGHLKPTEMTGHSLIEIL